MRPLVLPDDLPDAFELFKAIADDKKNRKSKEDGTPGARHRDVLADESLREEVRARYQQYSAARTCLEALSPRDPYFEPAVQKALKSCYESTKLQAVKAAILKAQPAEICATCPYCGIGEIGLPVEKRRPRSWLNGITTSLKTSTQNSPRFHAT